MAREEDRTLTDFEESLDAPDAFSPEPQLVLALRADAPQSRPACFHLSGYDRVEIGRAAAGQDHPTVSASKEGLRVDLPDRWSSSRHVRLLCKNHRWQVEDAGSKNGTLLNGVALKKSVQLEQRDVIELGRSFLVFQDGASTDTSSGPTPTLGTFVAEHARSIDALARVSSTKLPVMILGESGTGKEVFASATHALSKRTGSFVAVNCGAIPATLIESELFGAKKGAFSGAEDRPGMVRSADGGTLFLDEIGELPHPSQTAFLRVLQQHEVIPVGGDHPVPVDFRLITATNRDLDALVRAGDFRADLLARISGLTIELPSLRDRRADLGILIPALLERIGAPEALQMSVGAARVLMHYDWPLNVRELEKALELGVALSGGEMIDLEHLPPSIRLPKPTPKLPPTLSASEQAHKEELLELLQQHKGNVTAMSKAMGKARMQLHRWFKRYDLDPEQFR